MTITEFLLARIADDEGAARAVPELGTTIDFGGEELRDWWKHTHMRWDAGGYPGKRWDGSGLAPEKDRRAVRAVSDHFDRHNPDRVLAECAAKRVIVEAHDTVHDGCPGSPNLVSDPTFRDGDYGGPCLVLTALASVYANHPDYREEWRP